MSFLHRVERAVCSLEIAEEIDTQPRQGLSHFQVIKLIYSFTVLCGETDSISILYNGYFGEQELSAHWITLVSFKHVTLLSPIFVRNLKQRKNTYNRNTEVAKTLWWTGFLSWFSMRRRWIVKKSIKNSLDHLSSVLLSRERPRPTYGFDKFDQWLLHFIKQACEKTRPEQDKDRAIRSWDLREFFCWQTEPTRPISQGMYANPWNWTLDILLSTNTHCRIANY